MLKIIHIFLADIVLVSRRMFQIGCIIKELKVVTRLMKLRSTLPNGVQYVG
jgi:hypothetical protein